MIKPERFRVYYRIDHDHDFYDLEAINEKYAKFIIGYWKMELERLNKGKDIRIFSIMKTS